MLPFTSLSAATATGPGASRDLEDVMAAHTMMVTVTGSAGGGFSCSVALEGSHDGVNWLDLANALLPGAGVASAVAPAGYPALVRYVRANVTTLTGGTSPTVTATIASSKE